MKANLDQWIKDAKQDIPDSGEYRRLNRALLKERMVTAGPRHRHHRVLLGILSLVFLMMFSGQLNQLGSGDFEMVREDWVNPRGKTIPVMRNEFRGNTFTVPKDFSPEDLDEMNRSMLASEGELVWVQGTSYGGKTNWLKYVNRVINGKTQGMGGDLEDRPYIEPDDYFNFLDKYAREIVEKTRSTPPQRETVMTFDGVVCNVKIWVFHFPEFGEVTRYIGTPIQGK